MPLVWPLTGRSKELRLVDAAMTNAESSGIVIRGEAGVGKSRMAREALSVAAARGHRIHWIVGTSSARVIPLGALASWLGPDSGQGLELVRGAVAALTAGSGGKAPVLGIDDAPLLDELSTFVVQQIIAHRAAKVVLTIRDGDPVPAFTQELSRVGQFDWLDLAPLSRDDTITLLSTAVDGLIDPVAAEQLWALTRGNALYLRNIVEYEIANDRFALHDGMWRWHDEAVVPPSLLESVEARIGELPPEVADVIDTLAVGEPLDIGALTNITSAAAVEEADVRGLIALEPLEVGMEVRVAHPLYGEVRRSRAASTRLRRLRGAVAGELAARHGEDDMQVAMRRAALTLDSNVDPDPALLTRGAEWAVRLGDWGLAKRLGEAAVRFGGGAQAIETLAYTLSLTGHAEEGERLLDNIDPGTLSDADRATWACKRSGMRLFTMSDPVGAKTILDNTAATIAPDAHTCIEAGYALYASATGDAAEAQHRMKNFEFDELPDHVVGQIANMGATILGIAGSTAQALELARKGRARLAYSLDAAVVRYSISDAEIRALLLAGRLSEALDVTERLRLEAMEWPGGGAVLAMALSCRATLGVGHVQTACTMLDPIVMTLTAMGENVGMRYQFLIMQATAHAMRGAADEAALARRALEESRHPGWRCVDYDDAIARAWVSASQGAISEAVATSLSGAEKAGARGQFAGELVCLQAAAQFGDHSRAPRLAELEKIVEGPRPGLVRRFADALQAGDGAALTAVSEAYEEMGDPVVAADASAHAAIAHRRKDQRGSALGCDTRADALAKRCGIATPAVREAAEPIPLTMREREVVRLLGRGVSTRDIAKRLTLSVRTVEGHVYRAMAKTGTTTRQELAALLEQPADETP